MTSAALLGTGAMGAGMAASIRRAGLDLAVWNRSRDKAEPLAGLGARVADSPQDAVRDADVVVTMLFDADAVADVMQHALPAMKAGAVWVQASTVGEEGARRLAALADSTSVAFVDGPVLGTKQPAEKGELVGLVSGPAEAKDTARPVIDAYTKKIVDAGDEPGRASALKLVGNAWLATLTAGIAQSVAFARALGLDPQLFLEAMDGGPLHAPYLPLKGGAMIAGQVKEASFALDGLRKDIALIREAMAGHGVELSLMNGVATQYDDAHDRGFGSADIAAVVEAYS